MATAAKPTNGYDADKLKGYINRCEEIDAEIRSETGAFMSKIKVMKTDRKNVIADAKNDGIPTRPLKALLKRRDLIGQMDAIDNGLEGEDADSFAAICDALGTWAEEVAARGT